MPRVNTIGTLQRSDEVVSDDDADFADDPRSCNRVFPFALPLVVRL